MRNLQSLRLLLADKDKEIEQLKKELTEEKKASIRMYNQYTEVKEKLEDTEKELFRQYDRLDECFKKIEKAIEYIKSELYWCTDNVYTMNMVDLEKLVDILKGEDKE